VQRARRDERSTATAVERERPRAGEQRKYAPSRRATWNTAPVLDPLVELYQR
jgi:hypothetical protein